MITITCPSSRMNNHRYMYSRFPKMSLINIEIEDGGMKFASELTVDEAENLARELMEWVSDIKDSDTTESA